MKDLKFVPAEKTVSLVNINSNEIKQYVKNTIVKSY